MLGTIFIRIINMSNLNSNFSRQIALPFCLTVLAAFFISNSAFAADGGALTTVLCNVVKALQGTMGKAIATIGICVLGIGLFLGKINWALGIATAIGIGLIFGASSFINWITEGGSDFVSASGC